MFIEIVGCGGTRSVTLSRLNGSSRQSTDRHQKVSTANVKNTKQIKERREFLKKAAYAAPVILTLKSQASFAGIGSEPVSSSSSSDDPDPTY